MNRPKTIGLAVADDSLRTRGLPPVSADSVCGDRAARRLRPRTLGYGILIHWFWDMIPNT